MLEDVFGKIFRRPHQERRGEYDLNLKNYRQLDHGQASYIKCSKIHRRWCWGPRLRTSYHIQHLDDSTSFIQGGNVSDNHASEKITVIRKPYALLFLSSRARINPCPKWIMGVPLKLAVLILTNRIYMTQGDDLSKKCKKKCNTLRHPKNMNSARFYFTESFYPQTFGLSWLTAYVNPC